MFFLRKDSNQRHPWGASQRQQQWASGQNGRYIEERHGPTKFWDSPGKNASYSKDLGQPSSRTRDPILLPCEKPTKASARLPQTSGGGTDILRWWEV